MSAQVDGSIICRVCMGLATPETSWNLFDLQAGTDGYSLAQLVALVGGIEVRPEEVVLPAWCCFQCQTDVETAYRVRMLCQESDRELREMLASELGTVCKMEVEEPAEGNPECEENEEVVLFSKKRKKFKCSYCPKFLTTQQGLQFHEYGHQNPFAWKCTRCTEVFTNYNKYRAHFSSHEPPKGKIFRCGTCVKRFKYRSSLRKHVAYHCNPQKYKCSFCAASYARRTELSRHLKKVHQRKQDSVVVLEFDHTLREAVMNEPVELKSEDTCDAVVKIEVEEPLIRSPEAEKEDEESTNIDSQSEESEVFEVIPTKDHRRCCTCRNVFPNEASLLEHASKVHKIEYPPQHTSTNKILCNVCYNLIYRHSYRSHIARRKPKALFRCKACGELFFSKKMILSHNLRNHNKTGKCCGCKQIFDSVEALLQHSNEVHLPERRPPNEDRRFECNICYRTFIYLGHLHEHRSKSNHFECTTCKKSFDFLRDLTKHEAIHKDPLIYTCRHCSRVFEDYSLLMVHERRVHREKETTHCKPCGLTYRTRISLVRHNISHHGIPGPYACELCSESFALAADVKNHTRKVHPEASFSVKVEADVGEEEGQGLVCKLEVEEPTLTGLDDSEDEDEDYGDGEEES